MNVNENRSSFHEIDCFLLQTSIGTNTECVINTNQHIKTTTIAKYRMRTLAKYIRRFVGLLATSVVGYYRICGHDSLQHKALWATYSPIPGKFIGKFFASGVRIIQTPFHFSRPQPTLEKSFNFSSVNAWVRVRIYTVVRRVEDSRSRGFNFVASNPPRHTCKYMKSERDTLSSVKFNFKFRLTRRHF